MTRKPETAHLWSQFIKEEVYCYTCEYCGSPSMHYDYDQRPPVDYCHHSDHGDIEDYYTDDELKQMFSDWLQTKEPDNGKTIQPQRTG